MKLAPDFNNRPLVSVWGAVLTALAGLLLWRLPQGESLANLSYDYLFWFGARPVTNNVVLIVMDNNARSKLSQDRSRPWDRELHARLLNRLADDGCALVVFDSLFKELRDPQSDDALAAAMRRQEKIILMAGQVPITESNRASLEPVWPAGKFLEACGTNTGVAWFSHDLDMVVREQWPFPSPGAIPSLPWVAARRAGNSLDEQSRERWLRYYGRTGQWPRISYHVALEKPKGFFHGKTVFIGSWPETTIPSDELDEFSTPYTRWTGDAAGGVELVITAFLNILNNDSLLRPALWVEGLLFVVSGVLLGGGLCRVKLFRLLAWGPGLAVGIPLAAVSVSYYTNYWFPWFIVMGAQLPCALGWAAVVQARRAAGVGRSAPLPCTPGYELIEPPFGEGAYGEVWLARTKSREWRALKAVYRSKFGDSSGPYDREFNGVKKYQPISDRHPALLRIDFLSAQQPEFFYYVMELGDSATPGWQNTPGSYRPRNLATECERFPGRRLPVEDCLRIGIALTEALGFLHQQGMTHRDIKPQNIIFVDGKPKLADLGLLTDIRPMDEGTLVGTPGYMPPHPERPGTVAADIYALGMVLYVLSTGRAVLQFPEIATTLVNPDGPRDFMPLNDVILRACQPEAAHRYATAAEMKTGLEAAQSAFGQKTKRPGAY